MNLNRRKNLKFHIRSCQKIVAVCLLQEQNNQRQASHEVLSVPPGAIKQQATLPIAKWEFRVVKSLWRTPVTALN
jgi:hypothetical protein